MFTEQEVLEFVREGDVRFVRLAFCDAFGVQKNVSIMAEELPRAFQSGVSFDASAIRGFSQEQRSDLFLFPDPATLAVLPWRPSRGRVARLFCDIRRPDGTAFWGDTRQLLKRTVARAAEAGLRVNIGTEIEFYLFQLDEKGRRTDIPFDDAGYMDIAPEDRGENVRREICLTLAEMGLYPESSHHEEGPGQNEIDFRFSDALSAADNAVTFQAVVKTIAMQNGLFADFSPKPISNRSGNGLHVNLSLAGAHDQARTDAFMAGLLAHAAEMTAFLNPTAASYLRLGKNKAPRYVSWSRENRSQLIRIPASDSAHRRIELRSPDPAANPYLAFALILEAGLDGVARGLTPPPPNDHDLYTAGPEITGVLEPLPQDAAEAQERAFSSGFVRTHVPEGLLAAYASLRH